MHHKELHIQFYHFYKIFLKEFALSSEINKNKSLITQKLFQVIASD